MLVGHALDQTLVAQPFVDCLQRVKAVLQGQFDLAGCVLGNRRASPKFAISFPSRE